MHMKEVTDITNILRSNECAQIDFTFRCISISRADVRNVAGLVQSGVISMGCAAAALELDIRNPGQLLFNVKPRASSKLDCSANWGIR
jgi:hypothetical protein